MGSQSGCTTRQPKTRPGVAPYVTTRRRDNLKRLLRSALSGAVPGVGTRVPRPGGKGQTPHTMHADPLQA